MGWGRVPLSFKKREVYKIGVHQNEDERIRLFKGCPCFEKPILEAARCFGCFLIVSCLET